jgi:hypothetical protein
VSSLGDDTLVFWMDQQVGGGSMLRQSRLSPEGTVLASDVPIFEVSDHNGFPRVMASGDGSALFTASFGGFLSVTHVTDAGATGTAQLNTTPLDSEASPWIWMSSSFDGRNHLLVWGHTVEVRPGDLPNWQEMNPEKDGTVRRLRAARLTPAGAVLDDPSGFPIAPDTTVTRGLSAAFDGVNHVVVWLDPTPAAPSLWAVRIAPDGTVLDPAPRLVVALPTGCDSQAIDPSAAVYDGSRTIVGFRGCGPSGVDVFGVAFDANLAAGPIFPISDDAAPDGVPTLASNGAGVTLAVYSSFRAEAPFGSRRMIARRLFD